MLDDPHRIDMVATIAKLTSMADNSIRVAFDLAEGNVMQAAWLLQVKESAGVVRLRIELVPADAPPGS